MTTPTNMRETWREIWSRRAISIPIYHLCFAGVVVFLPILVPLAIVVDVVRQDRWSTVRALSFLLMYLSVEFTGMWALFFAWLLSGIWLGRNQHLFTEWNYGIQRWWATVLDRIGRKIYDIAVEIENPELGQDGGFILFIRHAAMVDTILPATLFIVAHRMRLRYVMKRSLLWDACLDIGGNRLPNYFVRRGGEDTARDVEGVTNLIADIPPDHGVMIYPEGTRFSHAKRKAILAKLIEKGDAKRLAMARALRHVLPPRLAGSLALLKANKGLDALFCAHVGFEKAARAYHLFNGDVVGQTIRIHFWRVPFAEIPREVEAQIEWLYAYWQKVDDWIDARLNPPAPAPTPNPA